MTMDPQDIDLAAASAASMERRFRRRLVGVTAIQWTGENESELAGWTGRNFAEIAPEDRGDDPGKTGELLDARHSVWVPLAPGDWVVRLEDGDVVAFSREQFEADFEPVEPVDPVHSGLGVGAGVRIDAPGVSANHGRTGVVVESGEGAYVVRLDGETDTWLFGASAVTAATVDA